MRFNPSLCDAICDVQLFLKVTGDIVDTHFYRYINRTKRTQLEKKTFLSSQSEDPQLFDALSYSEAASKWFIANVYHDVVVNNALFFDIYLSELLVKYDDREFMYYLFEDYSAYYVSASLFKFGTLEQLKWLHSIRSDLGVNELADIVETTTRLEIMKFIYEIRQDLFESEQITDILDLVHESTIVKRDLETLEWLIEKLGFEFQYPGNFHYDKKAVINFFRTIIDNGDDSMLEWLFVNHTDFIREVVNRDEMGDEILHELALKSSHRIFLMYLSKVDKGYIVNRRNYGDTLKNIAMINML